MRRDRKREAIIREASHDAQDFMLMMWIQVRHGFVHQETPRALSETARDQHQLSLAPADFGVGTMSQKVYPDSIDCPANDLPIAVAWAIEQAQVGRSPHHDRLLN
jgi:hypothetical protein